MLTQKEIVLIKESWAIIRKTYPGTIGDIFYSKLFYDNPELRDLFTPNMGTQYTKLIDMLNLIISKLENLDDINRDITAMAKRHVNYGVKTEHYSMVGKALLWTLQKLLADEWNDEIRNAWVNCYAILSGTMIAATSNDR